MKRFKRADPFVMEKPLLQRKLKEESDLRIKKTQLEIKGLGRNPWLQPVALIPILAAIGTIGVAWQQGVFDVQRKLLELEGKEIVARNRDLAEQESALVANLKILKIDQEKLAEEKLLLSRQKASLRIEVDALQEELAQVRSEERVTRARAIVVESSLVNLTDRVRRAVVTDVANAIFQDCTAKNFPLLVHLYESYQPSLVSQLDANGADVVFPSNLHRCAYSALMRVPSRHALTAKDLSTLEVRLVEELKLLEETQAKTKSSFERWHSMKIDDVRSLPEIEIGYLASPPPNLDEARKFEWKIRNFKVKEAMTYNESVNRAMQRLIQMRWPKD